MDKLKRSTRRNIQTVTGVIIFFTLFGILGKAEVDAKVENTQKIAVAVSGTADA